ncbi:AraC family transcriptional regulator ligand-binding domain-containing protein (plasmid) [Bradyrhizobium sp. CB82]|uniref:AraC family transcriptional regulator n=1 Tax=Bradyrhizobium sp. CB82 TaxID=3039159 RepID=UPI0024B18CC1|nr:AraC family transcriptional regulator [Bradyrhizobium sp. CB82]WFU45687.1 AraC family transcriptional regulator ligand-binding domain-containing protein [Bradyrhizobium sp. CB82]
MSLPGPNERLFSVIKIKAVVDSLVAEGISERDALSGTLVSPADLRSPKTRVSLNQVIQCYKNALGSCSKPGFAFRTGLRCTVSTYGLYGFAIFSSTSFRRSMRFTVQYHQLACPVADICFSESGQNANWAVTPAFLPQVDIALYRFIVEQQFGIQISLHRDIMGPSFEPRDLRVTYSPAYEEHEYQSAFGYPLLFNQPENALSFDRDWLDKTPKYGDELTYETMREHCIDLLDDMRLKTGVAGKVRHALLPDLARPTTFSEMAIRLGMSDRTLRRRLQLEGTSFRDLIDELRMEVAIRYLRDTTLSVEDISTSLGFSDPTHFRQAFRRWTGSSPGVFQTNAQRAFSQVIDEAANGGRS